MQQSIIHFFTQVLQNNKTTLNLISDFQGELYFDKKNSLLIFSLKGLHQLLTTQQTLSTSLLIDYAEFRKLIYQGNINEQLLQLGGKLEIHKSSGKVEANLYKLTRV